MLVDGALARGEHLLLRVKLGAGGAAVGELGLLLGLLLGMMLLLLLLLYVLLGLLLWGLRLRVVVVSDALWVGAGLHLLLHLVLELLLVGVALL